jgi:hypothetical protein
LRELAARDGGPLISCYVPIVRTGKEVSQNRIRVKNALREVEAALQSSSADKRVAAAASRRIQSALEEAIDEIDASRGSTDDGWALFGSADDCLMLGCNCEFAPSITVAERFYVVPLLELARAEHRAYVLAISRHGVRLISISREGATEVQLSDAVPRSLTDVVGEERRYAGMQQHSVGGGTIFHGHGEGEDDVVQELEAFCRRVGSALATEVDFAERSLVLAGDVQITATFRRVNGKLPLLERQISGSHDRTSAAELHELAKPILAAAASADDARLRELFHVRHGHGRASDEHAHIARAAEDGRIDTLLLVDCSAHLDGVAVEAVDTRAAYDEGAFNREVVLTLRHSGTVQLLEPDKMPTRAPLAAIYRF